MFLVKKDSKKPSSVKRNNIIFRRDDGVTWFMLKNSLKACLLCSISASPKWNCVITSTQHPKSFCLHHYVTDLYYYSAVYAQLLSQTTEMIKLKVKRKKRNEHHTSTVNFIVIFYTKLFLAHQSELGSRWRKFRKVWDPITGLLRRKIKNT